MRIEIDNISVNSAKDFMRLPLWQKSTVLVIIPFVLLISVVSIIIGVTALLPFMVLTAAVGVLLGLSAAVIKCAAKLVMALIPIVVAFIPLALIIVYLAFLR